MAFLEALPLTCLVIAIVAILRWLLTAPYRGVGAQYYAKGTSRRFLLTGCASGMGRHLTGVLLKLGHRVAATDVNETGLRAAAAADGWEKLAVSHEPNGAALLLRELDVCDRGQWESVLLDVDSAWGGLDVCMNIAGLVIPRKIQDASAREVDLHIDVMIKGPVHGTQLARS